MDIKDSYLHGTVGVVKNIEVTADKLTYTLADKVNTAKTVTLPLATDSANGLMSKEDKIKLDSGISDEAIKLKNKVSLWGNTFDGTQSLTKGIWVDIGNDYSFLSGSSSISAMSVNSSLTNFLIGYGTTQDSRTINTFLDGYNIYFRTGAKQTAMIISPNGRVLINNPQREDKRFAVGDGGIYIRSVGTISELGQIDSNTLLIGSANYGLQQWVESTGVYNMQVGRFDGTSTAYALNLNPLGGAVNVGEGGLNVAGGIKSGDKFNLTTASMNLGSATTPLYLFLSRPDANYIWASANGGYINLGVYDSGTTSSANATLSIYSDRVVSGQRNNAVSLGTSSYRWRNVYSVNGDFSGRVLVGGATDDGETALQVKNTMSIGPSQTEFGLKFNRNTIYAWIPENYGYSHTASFGLKHGDTTIGAFGLYRDLNSTYYAFIGSHTSPWFSINSEASDFNVLATFNSGIIIPTGQTLKVGEATLSWDSANNALSINPLGGAVNVGKDGLNVSGTITGNLDGTYVNKLTGYTKATAILALAATDTLNTALGKLEYKADVAYNLVKGAYDGDGTIENLEEILRVLDGIKDTDTIQAIVGKYLPLTGGKITGGFGALRIVRNDNNASVVTFYNTVDGSTVKLGSLGFRKDGVAAHYDENDVFHALLHSGNFATQIGDYYLKTSGGKVVGDTIIEGTTTVRRSARFPLYVETVDTTADGVGIRFRNNGTNTISLYTKFSDDQLYRYNRALTALYTILDTGNFESLIGNTYLKTDGSNVMGKDAYIAWNTTVDGNDVADWDAVKGRGLRIISSTSATSNAPDQYSTALHVIGRYGFQLAVKGGSFPTFHIRSTTTGVNTWREILHSGNVGEYAALKDGSNASGSWGINISGSAAKLGGIEPSRFMITTAKDTGETDFNQNLLSTNRPAIIRLGPISIHPNIPNPNLEYGYVLHVGHADKDTAWELVAGYAPNTPLMFRTGIWKADGTGTINSNGWKTIAFTDSDITGNAATATKLKDAVSLWGNEFDGTADITGNLHLNNSKVIASKMADGTSVALLTLNDAHALLIGQGSGKQGCDTYLYGRSIYFKTGKSLNTAMTITEEGNMLVGTTTGEDVKFTVNGGTSINLGFHRINSVDGVPTKASEINPQTTFSLIRGYDRRYGLHAWIASNASVSLQASYANQTSDTCYALNLNPLGGAVNIASANALTNVLGHMELAKDLRMNALLMMNTGKEGIYLAASSINWHDSNNTYTDSLIRFASDSVTVYPNLLASRVLINGVSDDGSSALSVTGALKVCRNTSSADTFLEVTSHDTIVKYRGYDGSDGFCSHDFYSHDKLLLHISATNATSQFYTKLAASGLITASGGLYIPSSQTLTIGGAIVSYSNDAVEIDKNLHVKGEVTGTIVANRLASVSVVNSKEFNLSNVAWVDTGYTFENTETGTYVVQISFGTTLVASGMMSVYNNLADTAGDEIPLHVYGTEGWRPYLRTYANKLQISSNDTSSTSRTVTIKIARIL